MNRLQYIDALRGGAILIVVAVHTSLIIPGLNPWVHSIVSYGNRSIYLFFIISTITLCMSFDNDKKYQHRVQRYFVKRFFRIIPLYYTGILLYSSFHALRFLLDDTKLEIMNYTFLNVGANMLLINDFFSSDITRGEIVPGGWSIGLETSFYLIFPLFFFFIRKKIGSLLMISIITLLTFVPQLYYSNSTESFKSENIFNTLQIFGMGLFYYQYLKVNKLEFLIPNKRYSIVFALGSTALSIALFLLYGNTFFVILLSSISLICTVELFKHFPKLSFPFLVKTGKLSYSIYLLHFIPTWYVSRIFLGRLLVVSPEFAFMVTFLFSLVSTFIAAKYSEKFIERNGITLGRKIIARYYSTLGSKASD